MSAVRFIKLLFQYKQPDAFTELSREMLQVLSVSSTQTINCNCNYSEKGIYSISISSHFCILVFSG